MGYTEIGGRGQLWPTGHGLHPALEDWAYIFAVQLAWQKASASFLVVRAKVPGLALIGQTGVTCPSLSQSEAECLVPSGGWSVAAIA